jgi:hypothetical protein
MNDDGYVPPMMPDDFAALAEIAGPLYQQSKIIERFTSDNPIPGAFDDFGSSSIKRGLEQAKQLAQATVLNQQPRPVYVPPAMPMEQPDVAIGTASFVPYPQPIPQPIPQQILTPPPTNNNEQQLELQFRQDNANVTNDLLREISRKLSKVISLLENSERGDKIPKLKPNAKQTQV